MWQISKRKINYTRAATTRPITRIDSWAVSNTAWCRISRGIQRTQVRAQCTESSSNLMRKPWLPTPFPQPRAQGNANSLIKQRLSWLRRAWKSSKIWRSSMDCSDPVSAMWIKSIQYRIQNTLFCHWIRKESPLDMNWFNQRPFVQLTQTMSARRLLAIWIVVRTWDN